MNLVTRLNTGYTLFMPKSKAPTPGGNRLSRSVIWNYIGFFYQIAINLGLTSCIARYLTVTEYGLFLFLMALTNTLYVLDVGISAVLVQGFVAASTSRDTERFNDLLCTASLTLAAIGTLSVILLAGLAAALPGPFRIPSQFVHEASLVLILGAFILQVGFPTMAIELAYQSAHRFDRLNQTQIISATLQLGLSILVLTMRLGIVSLAAVQLAAIVVRFLMLAVDLPGSVPGARLSFTRFKKSLLVPLLHQGKWAFMNNLGFSGLDFLIWAFLGSFASMEQAALFGLANKLPRQLWNLIDKGASVSLPVMSKAWDVGDLAQLRQNYLRTLKLLFGVVLPLVMLGCIAGHAIILVWAGSRYERAAVVMQFLLLAVISHVNGYASSQLLYACGEVKRASSIAVCEYALSAVFALPLIRWYGAAGLAAGMMIAQMLVNFGWLTWAACKLARISLYTLFQSMIGGLGWPASILAMEMIFLSKISSRISPGWFVAASAACGCVYMLIWGARTALPLWRMSAETAA